VQLELQEAQEVVEQQVQLVLLEVLELPDHMVPPELLVQKGQLVPLE
jgi:hypothetical protein